MDWRTMDWAPKDGTPIRVRTSRRQFDVSWQTGLVDDHDQECGAWHAEKVGDHPPCWTDGICWASNEDGRPSEQPQAWQPLPEEP